MPLIRNSKRHFLFKGNKMATNISEIYQKSTNYTNQLQAGFDPIAEYEKMKVEFDRIKNELSKFKSSETVDIEKKISTTEDGKALIAARDKSIKELTIELLTNTPLTAHRAETIISKFKEEAQRILDGKAEDN